MQPIYLLVYKDKLGSKQRGEKGKQLYMRAMGAGPLPPRGSAVELILKWRADPQQGSPFLDWRGTQGEGRCQHFHLLLIVLRLTSADNGNWAGCPGHRSVPTMTGVPGRVAPLCHLSPFLASHFGIFSHPCCVLGRQCTVS